mgnify:CR=1 FL=1
MDAQTLILHLHAFATLAMVGLIWFVQVNHYPLFALVADSGDAGWTRYERAHQTRTTLVVMPLMLTELATAAWVALYRPAGVGGPLALAGLALLGVLWGSTFLVAVPLHRRLSRGFRAETHRTLVLTNWARTAAWSARGVLALAMLQGALLARGEGMPTP